jgi:hypothetical protein
MYKQICKYTHTENKDGHMLSGSLSQHCMPSGSRYGWYICIKETLEDTARGIPPA